MDLSLCSGDEHVVDDVHRFLHRDRGLVCVLHVLQTDLENISLKEEMFRNDLIVEKRLEERHSTAPGPVSRPLAVPHLDQGDNHQEAEQDDQYRVVAVDDAASFLVEASQDVGNVVREEPGEAINDAWTMVDRDHGGQ